MKKFKKSRKNGIIFSKTDKLALNDFKTNKNTLVLGGAASGKTRLFVTPNIMQMNSSYVISDPRGLILYNVGKLLTEKGKYKIKNFNLLDYQKSMHYNPFSYIYSKTDIFKLANTIIVNTEGENDGDELCVLTERLLLTAFIGYIFYECPSYEKNFGTLVYFFNTAKSDENSIDVLFERLKTENPNHFAVEHYMKYKKAAGKESKSILNSCASRLALFEDKKLLELMSYDELELETLGGSAKDDKQKTALFVTFSPFGNHNVITAIIFTQLFSMYNDVSSNVFKGDLPIPVHFILDEFQFIGKIPNLDKIISTLGRNIWVSIIIQTIPQIKTIYKDVYEEIIGFCDNLLFLGSMFNEETITYISERFKINQDVLKGNTMNDKLCLVARANIFSSDTQSFSFSKKYDITKNKLYKYLSE